MRVLLRYAANGCQKGELVWRCDRWLDYLYGGEDGVGFADDADDDRTLLHSFLCIFDLKNTALRGATLVVSR